MTEADSSDLVPAGIPGALGRVNLDAAYDRAQEFAEASHAPSTRRMLAVHWREFSAWCDRAGVTPLPASPATVALYLSSVAGELATSTLARRLWAIAAIHHDAGHESPTISPAVARVWKGIKRTKGEAPDAKRAILGAELRSMVEGLPATAIGVRNRALLLIGYYGAFRRAELVALDAEDLQETVQGIVIAVRRSKTDQTALGTVKAIPSTGDVQTCPVRALRAWMDLAEITSGPLFRRVRKGEKITGDRLSPDAVAVIVKAAAGRLGFDTGDFAGHSLRAGFATQGAVDGATDREIMHQTGHKSRRMVDRYVRVATIWQGNAATKLKI